jgi:hypothetical protein
MVAWLQLVLFLASQQNPAVPIHKIDIRIAGSVATVEVWRTVDAAPRAAGNRQEENTLDLDLPDRAALVDWEILERGERVRMAQQTEGQVGAGLAAALKMRQMSPSTAPVEEGTDYRIHLTPLAEGARPVLHYRYVAPVACNDGHMVLRMPESLEENPIPADVTVTLEPHPDGFHLGQASLAGKPAEIRSGTRRLVMRGLSPARAAWETSWSYLKTPSAFPGQLFATVAALPRKGRGKPPPQVATVAAVCLGRGSAKSEVASAAKPAPPASVFLVVDRSRSVGQGGLSEERVVARALVEALPPSVRFNAILFGETPTPIFPLSRMPTREALEAFSSAADPNRLERTTDLVAALARVRSMNQGFAAGSSEQSWVAIVTDGALPPSQTAEKMQEALTGKAETSTRILVLVVRQRGDDSVSKPALAEYARLVEGFGGIVREVAPGSAEETARAVVSAMAEGGDWFGLRFDETKMADVLAAGQGATASYLSNGRLVLHRRLRFSTRGIASPNHPEISTVHVDVTPATAKGEWLEPLVSTDGTKRRAWAGATSSVAVAVLPASAAPKKVVDEVVHGRLDETVLRNTLSLAFMPRTRACYVSRRVATAKDAYLRGRVRLELTIERGELHDVVVRQSTINNPDIEACLRKAAWAVDYPRPEHRDALTVANLNLVFRPHTPEETRPDASSMDREIELIMGPLTFTTDFKDLLEKTPADKSVGP